MKQATSWISIIIVIGALIKVLRLVGTGRAEEAGIWLILAGGLLAVIGTVAVLFLGFRSGLAHILRNAWKMEHVKDYIRNAAIKRCITWAGLGVLVSGILLLISVSLFRNEGGSLLAVFLVPCAFVTAGLFVMAASGEIARLRTLNTDARSTYDDGIVSFRHRETYIPEVTIFEDGRRLIELTVPDGTGLGILQYPKKLSEEDFDALVKQLIQEETGGSWRLYESPLEKKVGDWNLKGRRVVTAFQSEHRNVREILSVQNAEKNGIVIVTLLPKNNNLLEQEMFEDFWESLHIYADKMAPSEPLKHHPKLYL